MIRIPLRFCRLHPERDQDVPLPRYESELAAGLDVRAAVREPVTLAPGEIRLIPTGLAVAIPVGYELQVRPRSGLAIKYGITLANSPGTIDADYRGEIGIGLINLGQAAFTVQRGDRVAQLVLNQIQQADVQLVEVLDRTDRQAGGFGHTGI